MKNKKKIVAGLVAIVLLIGSVIGATLAWFTDSDDAVTNTFVVGNVEIVLYERETPSDAFVASQADATDVQEDYEDYLETLFDAEGENGASNFVPGYTVAKNAYVSNIGTVDAWVGATYTIPTALVTNLGGDGEADDYYGLDVVVNTAKWDFVKAVEVGTNTVYYYVCKDIVDSQTQAPVFVQSVSINEKATNEKVGDFFHNLVASLNGAEKVDAAARTFEIDINAYAIQAPSLNAANAKEALAIGFTDFVVTP